MRTLARNAVICLAVLTVPWLLGGCPGPVVTNQPPVANAGPNQSVNPGDVVTLNGAGSSDPDGDTLSFAWVQTAGTGVTLTNADTSTPTFTAPNTAEVLTFRLTVSDGSLTASDTVDVGVSAPVTATPILFVANFTGSNVVGYDISSVNNVNGNVPPTANLAGGQTLLSSPSDIVIASDGSLLVTNVGTRSITTYLNAHDLAGINGNVAPARNVQGMATTLTTPASLAVKTASDLLFVSDLTPARILVFASVSTSGFNGNMAPLRTITSPDVVSPIGINFGAGDTLYVANGGATRTIAVFDNASTLNGTVAATRVISSASFVGLFDVYVDAANDRMFVVDNGGRKIHVFENASTRNGAVMPDVTLTVSGAGSLTAIAVDSKGVGYIVDETGNAVYSYDNIATRNGTIAPDRTLKGTNTQLSSPIRVFLLND
jgi:sugar lactone lactonase YvrE